MIFLFADLMEERLSGLPIWYWWGGVTTFAVFFANFLEEKRKSEAKGKQLSSKFDLFAVLGISSAWVAIPVFSALWLAYKLYQLVTKQ